MNPTDNYTDAALVALLNQGDRKSFEIIYKTYAAELYKYARHIISNKEDCEEIVQEVFERLWSQHKAIQIKALRAYLYKSVKNRVINYFQHNEVKKKYAEHYRFFEVIYDSVDEEERSAETIHLMIERGIQQMPERVQTAIRLRLSENLSNKEIALRMNITNKTVDNYMHIVYTHFRASYQDLFKASQ
jgi:RNA polymerase sigma-70 factor (family 1)